MGPALAIAEEPANLEMLLRDVARLESIFE